MQPKFISLPNGTVINVATIVSVTVFAEPPSVGVFYRPSPDCTIQMQVKCESDQDAIDLRDRIIARLNEHSPIVPV